MKLTLLGTGCPSVDYKRCGSSNLISTKNTKVLVDCGSGVTQRLNQSGNSSADIDALLLTHLHTDHVVDLYPRLKKLADKIVNDEEISSRSKKTDHESKKVLHEKVRYEILRRFGYFVTESSEHFAEYVPWFIKQNRDDVIKKYKIPIEEYIDRCKSNIKLWKDLEKDMTPIYDMPLKRSNEYASFIMDGIANNNEVTINANVMNDNLIDNLPSNCCVEVPVIINSKGYKPQKFGKLPEQLAALMRTNINVQILTAEAALTKKREHIYHAAMLDPLTGANLTIDEIYSMTDKMIEAHGNFLPQYN